MDDTFIKFKTSPEWINFENYYSKPNFMQQIDFFRFEDANTNFLQSLLRDDNVYGLGTYSINCFIDLLATKMNDTNIKSMNNDISNVEVTKQFPLPHGRPDMLIRLQINNIKYIVVVEAKLKTTEHDEQLKHYREDIESLYKDTKSLFIFLALNKTTPISDDYIRITYKDLVEYVYIPCSLKATENNANSIEQYINSFVELYDMGNEEIDRSLIPISYAGKQLTISVYNRFSNYISRILINNDNFTNSRIGRIFMSNLRNLSDELNLGNDIIMTLDKYISKSIHKYYFKDKGFLGAGEFIYAVFLDIINAHPTITYEELSRKGLIYVNGDWAILVSKEDIECNPRKHYYRLSKGKKDIPITINDKVYYYCNVGTLEEMTNLINKIIDVYPEYQDKISVLE